MKTITFKELQDLLRTADALECEGIHGRVVISKRGVALVSNEGYVIDFADTDNPDVVCLGSTFELIGDTGVSFNVTPLFEHQLHPSPEHMTQANDDTDGFVTGVVSVQICEMHEVDLEGFLDLISERLVGNEVLYEVDYEIVGYRDKTELLLQVSGRLSAEPKS